MPPTRSLADLPDGTSCTPVSVLKGAREAVYNAVEGRVYVSPDMARLLETDDPEEYERMLRAIPWRPLLASDWCLFPAKHG